MATASSPAIAVLATSKCRAEARALSISAQTQQSVVPWLDPDSSVLERASTVLVDLDTNLEAALKLIRGAVTQHPHIPVVVLGLLESQERIVELAQAGASGYVSPNASFEEMLSVVKSARHGE